MQEFASTGLSASRFYMWRTVFAMAHADGVVTPHEVSFMTDSTFDLPLSKAQREILKRDIMDEQDPAVMFSQITEPKDRDEFFVLARVLCWSDGDYDKQEREVIKLLHGISKEVDAKAMLEKSKRTVQEIQLDKDQWIKDHADEESVFEYFGKMLKAS